MKRYVCLLDTPKPLWLKFRKQCLEEETTVPKLIIKSIEQYLQRVKLEKKDSKLKRFPKENMQYIAEQFHIPFIGRQDFDVVVDILDYLMKCDLGEKEEEAVVVQEKPVKDGLEYIREMFKE